MTVEIPIATLLAWVWIAFAIEVDNAVEATRAPNLHARFRISLAMWANALRLIGDDGVAVVELRARARAGANIAGLERWGWIAIGDVGGGRREGFGTSRGVRGDTVLRLTPAGALACVVWPQVIADVERRWAGRFGADVVEALRHMARSAGERMPWAPPEVQPGDGFRTHVIRGLAEDDHEPPLVALLGQALTALTLEHERGAQISLPLAANLLRVIDRGVARIRDLPRSSGLSKEAVAMSVAFLRRRGLAEVQPSRTIGLTPAGAAALDDYIGRAAQATNDQLRTTLLAIIAQGDALARGLVPPDGCWRSSPRYAQQTRRLTSDPFNALPWHPMVLHRGGWPDGS